MRIGLCFPKGIRLLKRSDYRKFYKSSDRLFGNLIVIDIKKTNDIEKTRMGLTVSKKYGKAHKRNRFKRVVREAFRQIYDDLPKSLDINIFPKLPEKTITTSEMIHEMRELLIDPAKNLYADSSQRLTCRAK